MNVAVIEFFSCDTQPRFFGAARFWGRQQYGKGHKGGQPVYARCFIGEITVINIAVIYTVECNRCIHIDSIFVIRIKKGKFNRDK